MQKMEGLSMSDMLFPVSVYLIGSVLSCTYTRSFLQEKYGKRAVFAVWEISYFFVQITVFEVLGDRFPDREVTGIILHVCVLLFMQFLLFEKDTKQQLFIAVSFVAGKETIKYIVSVFSFIFAGIWNKVFDFLIGKSMLNTTDKIFFWADISKAVTAIICTLFYTFLLYVYLYVIRKKFVKK